MDLSLWNPKTNQEIELDGDWEFYWEEWIEPGEEKKEKSYISMPAYWNKKANTSYGFCSYRLNIILPAQISSNEPLALGFSEADTAYKVYINGNLLIQVGTPSRTNENSVPRWEKKTAILPTTGRNMEIIIHASNFEHTIGGIWKPPTIGLADSIRKWTWIRMSYDLFLFGALFITGILHLLFYWIRQEEKSLFYFGLTALVSSVRPLVTDERMILYLFPETPWELIVKLDYLSFYLACPLFYSYILSIFPEVVSKTLTNIASSLCLCFAMVVIIFPVSVFSKTLAVFDLIYLSFSIYHYITFGKASKNQIKEGTKLMIAGMSFIFIFAVNDILYYMHLVNTTNTIALGMFAFVFIQTYYLARESSKTYRFNFRSKEKLKVLLRQSIKRKQKDKLAVIGHFTSEIVHDIQNRLLNLKFSNPNADSNIKRELEEIRNITENILDFAKNQFHLKKAEVPIEHYFNSLKPDILHLFQNKNIELIYDFDYKENINIDPFKIKSAILNLARNSYDAIPDSGWFRIQSEKENGLLYLIFSDNGEGIDKEILEKIHFEKLSTTKQNGHGFGLSSVKRIVEAHNAQFLIDSRPNEGTRITFIFTLLN
ncbi:7TM diverse intracellular signaling domain-containing protein [Leptospira sp. 'Mane']|uniref:7TM diverse intracellular signaling domain-containing protein n=1 Tax=Leptospira sp. 'Mane' TaxID=3387407 RepID=UPI00398AA5EC